MTPARIRELRAAGVLDGTKADEARIVLLDIYDLARKDIRPDAALLRDDIEFILEWERDTPQGRALRWARAAARRRARR